MTNVGGRGLSAEDDDALDGCAYELSTVLGRGGQGNVYAAKDPVSGTPLAVKVLHADASLRGRAALSREYQLLRELDHPAFPEVFGYGHLNDGRAWLAMRYFHGTSAHDWARTIGRAGEAERCVRVIAIVADMADAIGYLHGLGVVHGDIKPGNLLVDGSGVARVLDLGGASLDLGPDNAGRGFFRTVAYAPAEQLDKRELTPSADVYSLAVTALRMMTDRYPFGTGTRDEVRAQQTQSLDAAPVIPGCLPEATRALLVAALSTDPAARPADGRVFAAGLRASMRVPELAETIKPFESPPPQWPEPQLAAVVDAVAMAVAYPRGAVSLATLASGLRVAPAGLRRALDRLERHGWVRRTPSGRWTLPHANLERVLDTPGDEPDRRRSVARRLADEWEGDPSSPGRAHCQLVGERYAAAADTATRWARRALGHGTLAATVDCGAALDTLRALDEALEGPTLTSWLLLRTEVAALCDAGDPRIDGWLGRIEAGHAGAKARADELRATIALWRGEPSLHHRPLAIAARELRVDRYEAALALARSEVFLSQEGGDLHLAAEAALIAGEALAALGRLAEAARALADAAAWWPGREGLGQVALARAEVLRALGRWAEAGALLGEVHAEARTPWDRAAAAIGLAALNTDRGHPLQAKAWLLAIDPALVAAHARLAFAHTVELLRATALVGDVGRALAEAAEALVASLYAAGRHGQAARIGAWQAAAAWQAGDGPGVVTLIETAAEILDQAGHRLWWAEATTLRRWLTHATKDTVADGVPDSLDAFVEATGAWPLGMRGALAAGDIHGAWDRATRFMAHLDSAQAAAIELAPWAVRARKRQTTEGTA